MDPAWKTGDVQTQTWEGRAGPADYRLEVPALGSFPPFERFWREQARRLIRGLRSMGGPWPVELHASFQETRRDDAVLSGFWDISRRTGHAGWDLSRVAATFLPGSGSPQPLPVLFYPGRQRRLPPLVQREVPGLRSPVSPGAGPLALLSHGGGAGRLLPPGGAGAPQRGAAHGPHPL